MNMRNVAMGPVWAGATFRLDPKHLPQQVSYSGHTTAGDVSITLDERGAVLKNFFRPAACRFPSRFRPALSAALQPVPSIMATAA